jgi:hypothetical protein
MAGARATAVATKGLEDAAGTAAAGGARGGNGDGEVAALAGTAGTARRTVACKGLPAVSKAGSTGICQSNTPCSASEIARALNEARQYGSIGEVTELCYARTQVK